MPPDGYYTAREASERLGISLDTLRRWDRQGRLRTERDEANRRIVAVAEVERLSPRHSSDVSARNRFSGRVVDVQVDGVLARVEIQVSEPQRVVAVVTSEAVKDLGLEPGAHATALVKATSVIIEN